MRTVKSSFTSTRRLDPITLKEELVACFPSYTVTYSVMADSFSLRNKDYRHTLLYNMDKPTKLESMSLRMKRKMLVYNLALYLLLVVMWIGDKQWNAGKIFNALYSDNFLFLSILFLVLYQYLVYLMYPGLKRDLEKEHGKVRESIKETFVLKSSISS